MQACRPVLCNAGASVWRAAVNLRQVSRKSSKLRPSAAYNSCGAIEVFSGLGSANWSCAQRIVDPLSSFETHSPSIPLPPGTR